MDGLSESHEKAPPHGPWCWPAHMGFLSRDGCKFGKRRNTQNVPRGVSARSGHAVSAPLGELMHSRDCILPPCSRGDTRKNTSSQRTSHAVASSGGTGGIWCRSN